MREGVYGVNSVVFGRAKWQAPLMREHGRSDQHFKLAKMLPGVPAHGGLGDDGGDCIA